MLRKEKRLNKDRFIRFSSLLNSAEKSISRMKHKKMGSYGLGNAHTICICLLNDKPQGMTKTELAAACGVDKAQVSRVVTDLQKKNYVCTPLGEKGYKQKYQLTEEGASIAKDIADMILEINSYVSDNIPKDQIDNFYSTFETICKKLEKAEELFLNK